MQRYSVVRLKRRLIRRMPAIKAIGYPLASCLVGAPVLVFALGSWADALASWASTRSTPPRTNCTNRIDGFGESNYATPEFIKAHRIILPASESSSKLR